MTKTIGVLGAGTWGIVLATTLSNRGHDVTVWSAIAEEIAEYKAKRKNPNLPQLTIPSSIRFTTEIKDVCSCKDLLLFAVPSPYIRSTAALASPYIPVGQLIASVTKGIEKETLLLMSEVIEEEMNKKGKTANIVALSGPTHAEEVAVNMPTAIVAACKKGKYAEEVQRMFDDTCLRVYTNVDIRGVELCGALKNVIALAVGMASGLGYGDNTKAALITRGVAEIARLGMAMGCDERTFGGLAGVGDLIVTATSEHSRNNKAGKMIGKGYGVEYVLERVGMVVEGLNALPAAITLSERYGTEMPIIAAVSAIIDRGADPNDVVSELMMRENKGEFF